jgi:hypothetical protein
VTGILAVWNEVDPAIEDDYNDWYLYEHVPERLTVPGMRRARRYRTADGAPRYFACYETAAVDVLHSAAYRHQLDNPTAWTQRVMPGFRIMQRGICEVAAARGEAVGGLMAIIHLRPADGRDGELRDWLSGAVLPAMLQRRQIVAAQLWLAQPTPVNPTTGLTRARAEERPVDWVLVIEGGEPAVVETARDAAMASDLAAHGATAVQAYPLYRLMFAQAAS